MASASAIVVLLLLCAAKFANCSTVRETLKVNFTKAGVCPSSADQLRSLRRLAGVHPRACFVECAAFRNCSVIFQRASSDCYFGSTRQLAENFSANGTHTPDRCESYVRTWDASQEPPSARVSGINASLASKLVIMFDFRQGYTNLISPGTYTATPHGNLIRTEQGVNFTGGNNKDFIEVDTNGNNLASTYLSDTKSFTFYARLLRNNMHHQVYHLFHDCSASASNRGQFGDNGGRIQIVHAFPPIKSQVLRDSIENVFSNNNEFQLASVGVVFSAGALNYFFKDGSFLSTPNAQSSSYLGEPLCLRLGYHNDNTVALRGLFICYAVAKEALTLSELKQLEAYCG